MNSNLAACKFTIKQDRNISIPEAFVFVGNERIARVEHQKKDWYYYLKDHLGSSDIVMNSQNLPVEQMLYKPYGSEYDPKLVVSTGPAWANFTAYSDPNLIETTVKLL